MQISVNLNKINGNAEPQRGLSARLRAAACRTPVWNCFVALLIFLAALVLLYVCKTYTGAVLMWLEKQDAAVMHVLIVMLFTLVSFPVSVGYIVVVIASGYLFGAAAGLALSMIGANLGLAIAHNVMRLIGYHSTVAMLRGSITVSTIMKVIGGSSSFKIVFCARLTPIPFGLQNSIFAISNIDGKTYHLASLLGLLPGQMVGVYVGTSLRSMQEVLDDQRISAFTYFFATIQVIAAALLLVWIGSMARNELARALAEADSKLSVGDHKTVTNIV